MRLLQKKLLQFVKVDNEQYINIYMIITHHCISKLFLNLHTIIYVTRKSYIQKLYLRDSILYISVRALRCTVRAIAFFYSNPKRENTKTRKHGVDNYRVFIIVFSHLRHRTFVFSSSFFRVFLRFCLLEFSSFLTFVFSCFSVLNLLYKMRDGPDGIP